MNNKEIIFVVFLISILITILVLGIVEVNETLSSQKYSCEKKVSMLYPSLYVEFSPFSGCYVSEDGENWIKYKDYIYMEITQ
jgi:uncharacterized alpha/beta hydrolase family protein